jgi:hypothetical protein
VVRAAVGWGSGGGAGDVGRDSGAITDGRASPGSFCGCCIDWMDNRYVRLRSAALGNRDFQPQGNLVGAAHRDDTLARDTSLSRKGSEVLGPLLSPALFSQ